MSISEELELALLLILKYSLSDITRLNRDKIGGVQRRVQEAMTKSAEALMAKPALLQLIQKQITWISCCHT